MNSPVRTRLAQALLRLPPGGGLFHLRSASMILGVDAGHVSHLMNEFRAKNLIRTERAWLGGTHVTILDRAGLQKIAEGEKR